MTHGNGLAINMIDTPQALAAAAANWLRLPWVALDSEFMRVRTYYPQAALFQIYDGQQCHLIDPLAIENLEPLTQLLRAPGVLKIMHSCSEDLEVCERRLGALPEPLLDTQIAAAFCAHGLAVGYARMLELELDLRIDKSETRTDWLHRPLSEAQQRYAAEDVVYLPQLWDRLRSRLDSPPRLEWVMEECAAVLQRFRRRDTALAYRALGGAWKLDRRALAVLRALHQWRESMAQRRDLPRSWVLPDEQLVMLAGWRSAGSDAVGMLENLLPGGSRRHAGDILAEMKAALLLADTDLPEAVLPPLDATANKVVKRLRGYVTQRAEDLGIAAEMLARRRDIEQLIRVKTCSTSNEVPMLLQGWRRELIGEPLLQAIREAA